MATIKRFATWMFLTLAVNAIVVAARAEESPRQWRDAKGRTMIATLIAADGEWCTLQLSGGKSINLLISDLDEDGREHIERWMSSAGAGENGAILPQIRRPWPKSAAASENSRVTMVREDAAAGDFVYRTRHFELHSKLPLTGGALSTMAQIFEATLAALRALPVGIDPAPPVAGYQVYLFDTRENYYAAGGPGNTAGYFQGYSGRMLISLPDLGIAKTDDNLTAMNYRSAEYTLKHEVTHQIMGKWLVVLAPWVNEGWGEYLAAVPYRDGVYTFSGLSDRLLAYVNKWRTNEDQRRIPVLHPAALMTMSVAGWNQAITDGNYVLTYNSAAILMHYFLHHDGDGTAAHMIAYMHRLAKARNLIELEALASEARDEFLLRGRTYDQVAAELAAIWKKRGVTLVFEQTSPVQPTP